MLCLKKSNLIIGCDREEKVNCCVQFHLPLHDQGAAYRGELEQSWWNWRCSPTVHSSALPSAHGAHTKFRASGTRQARSQWAPCLGYVLEVRHLSLRHPRRRSSIQRLLWSAASSAGRRKAHIHHACNRHSQSQITWNPHLCKPQIWF